MRAGLRRNRRGLRCPGKPRDKESGLDDFGARAYSQFLGRWTGPDQPFVDSHIDNPQKWNLYVYANNNPVMISDPNGRWDESSHDRFLREALKNKGLSEGQINIVIEENNRFDHETQDKPYLHAMAAPGESKYSVWKKWKAFTDQTLGEIRESRAQRAKNGDKRLWTKKELILFARLQHPAADDTCKAHSDQETGEPLVWDPINIFKVVAHVKNDQAKTPDQKAIAAIEWMFKIASQQVNPPNELTAN